MPNALAQLNSLATDQARQEFLKCCGSETWARNMAEGRPYGGVAEMFSNADRIWWSLPSSDWLDAFHSHPKIGEKKAGQATSAEARAWAAQEQAGTRTAAAETLTALAAGNRDYELRFGYIFIVCATGKTSAEMLAILRARLDNDPETELRVAAEEQRKITQLRLNKLVESLESRV